MILIYISKVTRRAGYIFDVIFKEILRSEYIFTSDKDHFLNYAGCKLSYGKAPEEGGLLFGAADLLFDMEINKQKIELSRWNNIPTFYPVNAGVLPFDPFAASFYLLTRYEEYLPNHKDKHGRFKAEESLAFKGGFVEKPLINIWALEIKKIIESKYKDFNFRSLPYTFTPTIDIDNAYAYKNKGILRNASSLLHHLLKFEFGKLSKRVKVLAGLRPDPYDTYEKQNNIHKKYNVKPCYFFLLGDYGKFDKNLSWKNSGYTSLINQIASRAEVGIHPSYDSNSSEKQLMAEKERLEKIIKKPVSKSRQHYIRLNLPETYRKLIKAGIKEDYSMGYPARAGFRASICIPFYFYDLEEDRKTDLKIFPFVFMDTTLKRYMKIRSKEVVEYLKPLVSEVKTLGGHLIFIFHNESMGNDSLWKNWGNVYENVIKLAMDDK